MTLRGQMAPANIEHLHCYATDVTRICPNKNQLQWARWAFVTNHHSAAINIADNGAAGAMSALPAGAVPVVKFGFDDRDRSVQPSNDAKSTALGPDDDSIESGW